MKILQKVSWCEASASCLLSGRPLAGRTKITMIGTHNLILPWPEAGPLISRARTLAKRLELLVRKITRKNI